MRDVEEDDGDALVLVELKGEWPDFGPFGPRDVVHGSLESRGTYQWCWATSTTVG